MSNTTPLTDAITALTTYVNEVTGASDTSLSGAVGTLVAGYGGSSMASGTILPSSASTSLTFDTGLSIINGILVVPADNPYTGVRTQMGIIIIPSGCYFQAFSFYTNLGGTGTIAPTGYTNQTRFTQSGTSVTITGSYDWQTITYVWYAW